MGDILMDPPKIDPTQQHKQKFRLRLKTKVDASGLQPARNNHCLCVGAIGLPTSSALEEILNQRAKLFLVSLLDLRLLLLQACPRTVYSSWVCISKSSTPTVET